MTHPLVPCPECARHVRASESRCPFCSAKLELGATPPPRLPAERLGRAGVLGFQSLVRAGLVAATSSALAACMEASVTPVYGAPWPGTGGSDAIGGTSGTSGSGGVGGTSGSAGAKATGGSGGAAGAAGKSGSAGTAGGGAAGAGGTSGAGNAGTGGSVSDAGEGGESGAAGHGGEGGQ
jgi:hypothetical protein